MYRIRNGDVYIKPQEPKTMGRVSWFYGMMLELVDKTDLNSVRH